MTTLQDDLLAMEQKLWSGGKSAYRQTLDHNCLIAFTEMAGVSSRDQIADQAKSGRWHDLDLAAEGFLQPTDDIAILTYRVSASRSDDEPYNARVSSGYVRRNGEWKMMFHQQTPLTTKALEPRARADGGSATSDEQQIRGVLKKLSQALRSKDAESFIAALADDEVTFDLAPPLEMGPETTHDPATLEEWFSTWRGPIVSESHDLEIAIDGDLAYAYGLQHMTGTKTDGSEADLWFRATACFRREASRWRITHMHNSVPFAMDGSGKALLDLEP